MQKKIVIILNLIILAVVTSALIYLGIGYLIEPEIIKEEECVEVNKVASFIYESCYDAYTNTIFVAVERSPDNYHLKSFEFSFFDFENRVHVIKDIPRIGEKRAYKIPAEKNPEKLDVRMNIVRDFSSPVCSEPRTLFVKYCPSRTEEKDINAEISPFGDVDPEDFVDIVKVSGKESDIFSKSLVEKEAIWENRCSSSWTCSEWESCEDGLQRRTCDDTSDCYVPTKKPKTAQYCDGTCEEDWQCNWGECSGGFTTPNCLDMNSCGTTHNLPQKLSCGAESAECAPDITCGNWTTCEVDYNFIDLVDGSISELTGSKSRICTDKNKCSVSQEEVRDCSVEIDIYTKKFEKCGNEYIGVYNRLDNDLIARVDVGTKDNPHLNLYLDDQADSEYCDYCFNGRMDGDESGIDCGGGCMECSVKYKASEFIDTRPWYLKLF